MAPDPHQGGRLEDMAAEGTTIPGDAGVQRLVSHKCFPIAARIRIPDFIISY